MQGLKARKTLQLCYVHYILPFATNHSLAILNLIDRLEENCYFVDPRLIIMILSSFQVFKALHVFQYSLHQSYKADQFCNFHIAEKRLKAQSYSSPPTVAVVLKTGALYLDWEGFRRKSGISVSLKRVSLDLLHLFSWHNSEE